MDNPLNIQYMLPASFLIIQRYKGRERLDLVRREKKSQTTSASHYTHTCTYSMFDNRAACGEAARAEQKQKDHLHECVRNAFKKLLLPQMAFRTKATNVRTRDV